MGFYTHWVVERQSEGQWKEVRSWTEKIGHSLYDALPKRTTYFPFSATTAVVSQRILDELRYDGAFGYEKEEPKGMYFLTPTLEEFLEAARKFMKKFGPDTPLPEYAAATQAIWQEGDRLIVWGDS